MHGPSWALSRGREPLFFFLAVDPEAVVPDLADGHRRLPLQMRELTHGGAERREEPPLVPSEAVDQLAGLGLECERHVGVEHALLHPQVGVVLVVERVRGGHVQVLQRRRGQYGAVPSEAAHEPGVLAGAVDEAAAGGLADGVRAGERDEVGLVQAAAREGFEQLVGRGVGAWHGGDLPGRGGREAILAAERHWVPWHAGAEEGLPGGEAVDVGARHDGPAGTVHGGADALDEQERAPPQPSVLGQLQLAAGSSQVKGRVAALQSSTYVCIAEASMQADTGKTIQGSRCLPEGSSRGRRS